MDDSRDPVLERVLANRFTLALGALAAVVFGWVGLLLTGLAGAGQSLKPWVGWPMLALSAVVLVATLRQLVLPVPLIEVTAAGVRLRIRASMSHSGFLFVPWSHVSGVILTQTATSRGGREDALGFRITQDQTIRVPSLKWIAATAAPEAPQCDVVFAAGMIAGDVHDWVRKIEECRNRAG